MIDAGKIKRFEDMPVWIDSQDLAVSIYTLTKSFPPEEQFALTNQLRRCASSISANIAEGFGRKSNKEKGQFYRVAYGSLLEAKNFVYLACRLNYFSREMETQTIIKVESLQKQINAILSYFKDNA